MSKVTRADIIHIIYQEKLGMRESKSIIISIYNWDISIFQLIERRLIDIWSTIYICLKDDSNIHSRFFGMYKSAYDITISECIYFDPYTLLGRLKCPEKTLGRRWIWKDKYTSTSLNQGILLRSKNTSR